MNIYSPKVIDHFLNPRNARELADADVTGNASNQDTGIHVKMWLKIDRIDNEERIGEITYKSSGCVPAIAAGSVLTVLAQGKTLEEARDISTGAIMGELSGVPQEKRYTVTVALKAFKNALEQWEKIEHGVSM